MNSWIMEFLGVVLVRQPSATHFLNGLGMAADVVMGCLPFLRLEAQRFEAQSPQ